MRIDQFLRTYEVRAPRIMWFLGAGASSAAGIPTAYDLIWRLKRKLYCSLNRISERSLQDLSDPFVRQRVQTFFDAHGGFPEGGADEEYSWYFEEVYPAEADRRAFLESHMEGATPSAGHVALAALAREDHVRTIWTTNFDRVVEAALSRALDSTPTAVADLHHSSLALEAIQEERWPLVVKLHGDFMHRRLKNTSEELRAQDGELRRALVEACRRFGAVFVGYSGRDRSVLDALREAASDSTSFPTGLFWLHREGAPLRESVKDLIDVAMTSGIDAHIVEVQTFDEIVSDVCRSFPTAEEFFKASQKSGRKHVSPSPIPEPSATFPVLRMNAFLVTEYPATCRLIKCNIGGSAEVREAIGAAGISAVGVRKSVGVLAFGDDHDLRQAFSQYGITEFDLFSIDSFDTLHSSTLGFLMDALASALARERPILTRRVGRACFALADGEEIADPSYSSLLEVAGVVQGSVSDTNIAWMEAARLSLERRLERTWLVAEPTIFLDGLHEADLDDARKAREFVRKRLATRYNSAWNTLYDAWSQLLLGGRTETELRAFGIGTGVDASFKISGVTAFSGRLGGHE